MKKRITSLFLAIVMLVCMLPVNTKSVIAADASTTFPKSVVLGTDAITGWDETDGYHYIYYGDSKYFNVKYGDSNKTFKQHSGDPVGAIKWRVLDNQTNTGTDNGFFLLSEYLFGQHEFGGGIIFNWYQGTTLAEHNLYQGSDAQDWCEGFGNTNFSPIEFAAIMETTKDDAYYRSPAWPTLFAAIEKNLNGDKIFFPSAQEMETPDYGFPVAYGTGRNYEDENKTRATTDTAGTSWIYWTRSRREYGNNVINGTVGRIDNTWGTIFYQSVVADAAARPAFNLDKSAVSFIESATGSQTVGKMTAVTDNTSREWKLNLLDSSRNFAVTETSVSGKSGGKIAVNYTGAVTGENEYISALIVDTNGEVLYSGILSQASASGNVDISIPTGLAAGTYTLKLFNEQENGEKMTDYVSTFANVELTVEAPFAVLDGIEDNYYHTGLAIEPVFTVSVKESGKALVKDTDYTVAIENNINLGKATVTVTFIGDYASNASQSTTFKIIPNPLPTGKTANDYVDYNKNWQNVDAVITAKDGYLISTEQYINFVKSVTSTDTGTFSVAFCFKDTDDNGRIYEFTSVEVKVDKVAPTIMVRQMQQGDALVRIMVTARDTQSNGLTYSFDGGETWIAQAVTTVTRNGTYNIWVKDAAGNIATTSVNITSIVHSHSWSTEWTANEDYHWHECVGEDCDIIENSEKDKYEAHYSTGNNIATYTKKAVCDECGTEYGDVRPDLILPQGKITIKANSWTEFWNVITFGHFFKNYIEIEVIAEDNETGVEKIEYYLSDTAKDIVAIKSVTDWKEYTEKIKITANDKRFVYAKITDNAGNTVYVSTNLGIVVYTDAVADTENVVYTLTTNEDKDVNVVLNGNTVKSVLNGDNPLTLGTDYTVDGGTITLKGDYLDTLSADSYTFTVEYNPFDETYINGDAPATTSFTVKVEKQIVTLPTINSKVYNANTQIADVADTDLYTVVSNYGGTDVGKYEVILALKDADKNMWLGTDEASVTLQFEITKATNEWAENPYINDWTYGHAVNAPVAAAKLGTVEYIYCDSEGNELTEEPKNAGNYTVKVFVLETDNFTGLEKQIAFTIEPRNVTVKWTAPDSLVYDSTAKQPYAEYDQGPTSNDNPQIIIALTEGCDNVNTGTFTFTAIGISDSNYKLFGDVVSPVYTISPKVVTPYITVADAGSYDGTEKKPAVKIYDGDVEIPTSEYTVNYTDNINVGTASVIITDKEGGNYEVSGLSYFDISCHIVIPIEKKVIKSGTQYPTSETFTFELLDLEGNQINVQEFELMTVENTLTVNGEGVTDGYITITVDSQTFAYYLSDGFMIREVNDNAADWTYSDAVYYVMWHDNEVEIYLMEKTSAEGYKMIEQQLEVASFTNVYTKNVKTDDFPSQPNNTPEIEKSPQTGLNNISLFVVLLLLGIVGVVATTVHKRKKVTN